MFSVYNQQLENLQTVSNEHQKKKKKSRKKFVLQQSNYKFIRWERRGNAEQADVDEMVTKKTMTAKVNGKK